MLSSNTAAQPLGGGGGGRAKLLQEVLIQILQVSLEQGPVDRLIGAADAPGTQPAKRWSLPAFLANVGMPGASARIVRAGRQCKHRGIFLLQIMGDGLSGDVVTAVHNPTAHPLPHLAQPAARGRGRRPSRRQRRRWRRRREAAAAEGEPSPSPENSSGHLAALPAAAWWTPRSHG